jgi:hypothetical protein
MAGKTTPGRGGKAKGAVDFDTVRKLGLALPGVEEYTCYGTPALRVRKKLLARLREDGTTLVVKLEDSQIALLMQLDPQTYFLEDHYVGWSCVLVRLPRIRPEALARLLEDAWSRLASKRQLAEHGAA